LVKQEKILEPKTAILLGGVVLAVPVYLAIAYRSMYNYALKAHPTKVFPPGSKLVISRGNPATPALNCVVLGDSSSAGQGAENQTESFAYQFAEQALLQHYDPISLHFLAESGATTADVLAKQLEPAIALCPQLVMIAVGSNDLIRLRDRRSFGQNYHAILQKLAPIPVIVLNIPAFNCTPLLWEPFRSFLHWRARYFNAGLAQVCQRFPNVQLVDIYAIQDDGRADKDRFFSADKFHLSGLGYGLWAKKMALQVKTLPELHSQNRG
jgi:lysophospholipase L1-like esterase